MINFYNYIIEKLVINKNIGKVNKFTDEELESDYNTVYHAITKNEKKVIADKYGVNIYKIRDIQIEILNILRENRKNKKEFTPNDSQNFFRYDIPDRYDKFKKYLEEESIEFVEWLFERYKNKVSKINTAYRSYADNHVIRVYNNLKRYLNK